MVSPRTTLSAEHHLARADPVREVAERRRRHDAGDAGDREREPGLGDGKVEHAGEEERPARVPRAVADGAHERAGGEGAEDGGEGEGAHGSDRA